MDDITHSNNVTRTAYNFSSLCVGSDDCPGDRSDGTITVIPGTVVVIVAMVIELFVILTITFIRKLREGRPQRQLSKFVQVLHCCSHISSLFVFLLGFYIDGSNNYILCAAIAVILHYFVLMTFVWGVIEMVTSYLLYIIFHGLDFNGLRWKFLLIGSVLPVIPVIALISFQLNSYNTIRDICWIRPNYIYYFLFIPAGVAFTLSFIGFTIIFVITIRMPSMTAPARATRKRILKRITFLLVALIFNGLSWSFGYLVSSEDSVLFYYLMSVSTLLYGLVMLKRSLDPKSRIIWRNMLKPPPQTTTRV
ncbi:adhesion G protein-coupled receptor L4 isoform X2 [Patella vulgata]|uniref:adhesion G protein-coupled receptor L4 isoform X2 n=1 Tax=Patella vulgata TaxID=6465 RepID=UPI0024A94031|nr:adhesion G protein-coupled receptor L4 isoform X2 [Patella vulgata]